MTTARASVQRDYGSVSPNIPAGTDRDARMSAVVDALWDAFGRQGYSWVGFYIIDGARQSMLLAHRQPKPACSPIGLHGCCGRCWSERRPLVVHDVAALGNGYIACDPRDRSEVVVPLFNDDGSCWGVLDVDSFDVGAFTADDARGLTQLLERAGLSTPQHPAPTLQNI